LKTPAFGEMFPIAKSFVAPYFGMLLAKYEFLKAKKKNFFLGMGLIDHSDEDVNQREKYIWKL
jgi:hypothetical protein